MQSFDGDQSDMFERIMLFSTGYLAILSLEMLCKICLFNSISLTSVTFELKSKFNRQWKF
jgi:hypothetical protein